jgi:hypothetical protein
MECVDEFLLVAGCKDDFVNLSVHRVCPKGLLYSGDLGIVALSPCEATRF